MAITHSSIHAAVDAFLAEHRQSRGGYAEITPDDIEQLNKIIGLLVNAKCDPDFDGDRPIQWVVVDRTREWHPALRGTLPYSFRRNDNGTLSLKREIEIGRDAALYAQIYMEQAKRAFDILHTDNPIENDLK